MSRQQYRRIIAVDFDGTLAVTKFPEIIRPIPVNIEYCRQLKEDGAVLILWTCREGKNLQDAVEWCSGQGLTFDFVNEGVPETVDHFGGVDTRKVFANEYLDDRAVNPQREREWNIRLLRTLRGRGREAVVYAVAGCITGLSSAAAVMCLYTALRKELLKS